jgi:flagellar basal body-associated protein FliL
MVTMDDISNAIISLVRIGAVARFIYCMVRLSAAEEEATQYKKRAKNTVIFYIIAECIWNIKDLVLYYYVM